jgi:hypothetical protein
VLYSQHRAAYGVVIMAQMEESDGIDPNECQASVGSAAATQVTMSCSSLRLGLGRGDHHERGKPIRQGFDTENKVGQGGGNSTDLAVFAPSFPFASFVFRRSAAGKIRRACLSSIPTRQFLCATSRSSHGISHVLIRRATCHESTSAFTSTNTCPLRKQVALHEMPEMSEIARV